MALWRTNSNIRWRYLALLLFLPGCDAGELSLDPAVAEAGTGASGGTTLADAGLPPATVTPAKPPCASTFTGCAGQCGVIKDPCTGQLHNCGGCSKTTICSPTSHTCVKPRLTCNALGAKCGLIRNDCGKRLSCGACPKGQECDPDSNRCITCQQITCQDLGYQCGIAWLGCGPTSNLTDCGACPSSKVCNNALNLCEPACKPKSAATLCAAARTKLGVQCGYISDGCGGTVNCGGCPSGKGCGVAGVANRCEPLLDSQQCKALGKECGKLATVCGQVDCGSCPSGQVCNSNNLCGPPCKPKTCLEFAPKQCGVFSDGCKGTIACKCTGKGAVCLASGKCCVNTAKCKSGVCGSTVTDTCTGAKISCDCPSSQVCDKSSKTCKAKKTCATYSAGGTLSKCNDNLYYGQVDGSKFACPCIGSGWFCINDSLTKEGSCCKNVNPTCPTIGPGSCNSSVVNSCTGEVTKCTCPPGHQCVGTTCVANPKCGKYLATGAAGAPCSNGPSSSFPDGAGSGLTCPCGPGLACLDAAGAVVSGGATGTCKIMKTCADHSATGKVGEVCSNDKSASFSDGAGGQLACPCAAGYACADGLNQLVSGGATGYCKLKKTCADYKAGGLVGDPCASTKLYSDGFGGLFACPCQMSGGLYNNACAGETATQAGVCKCTAVACTCANSGLSDGCGSTLSCACPAGQSCNKKAAKCCPKYTCAAPPPAYPTDACGTLTDTCMGGTLTCGCSSSSKPNSKCVLKSGLSWGKCVCVPDTCAKLGVGAWPNDGCGKPITCKG